MKARKQGFTIVELLIVIVVIAILAAITIVAYNGTQQRARDARRDQDVAAIAKALELYYIDNGKYPSGGGSTNINSWWTTSSDASWQTLQTSLSNYINNQPLPKDPSQGAGSAMSGGLSYDYYAFNSTANVCGAGDNQGYLILYKYESQPRKDTFTGNCATNTQYSSFASVNNYRVTKK